MKTLLALDSFKGCLTAPEAVDAAAAALAGRDVCRMPLSDGGEGFAECLAGCLGGVFRTAPVEYWKDAPSALHPGKVSTNTVYHALVPEGSDRVMLELTAVPGEGLKVRQLAPLDDPINLSTKEFARLVAKTPYLISVDGKVYFCSPKKTSIDKDDFRASLFSDPQANRPPAAR